MAFKEISSLDADTVIALGGFNKKLRKDNPTEVEGYYLGTRQVTSPKSKSGFADLHIFQTATGNLGVWGKTDMDKKIRQVKPGTMTQVSFVGMKPTKNGEMYTFKVAVDEDNTIDVSSISDVSLDNNNSDDNGDDTDSESYEVAEETPTPAVNNAAAERAAKLAALINKGKKVS